MSAARSIIKAVEVAFVRFASPDLAEVERFLDDFGLQVARRTPNRSFMRGFGPSPFLYAAEQGAPRFIGFGLQTSDLKALQALAADEGEKVRVLDAPGGGYVVNLHDPDGNQIEVVVGQDAATALNAPTPAAWNEAGGSRRRSSPRRTYAGPSHVLRLGHIVFAVSDFARSAAWYESRFGLLRSEEVRSEAGDPIGAFYRFDLGDTPADHHALFIFQRAAAGFLHAAFEVVDLDDLMAGHDHLLGAGEQHHWGVGRHKLGSQVFDYWLDPWGRQLEHWTDGDRLTADVPTRVVTLDELKAVQWGMKTARLPAATA